jgi:hypothetical protein
MKKVFIYIYVLIQVINYKMKGKNIKDLNDDLDKEKKSLEEVYTPVQELAILQKELDIINDKLDEDFVDLDVEKELNNISEKKEWLDWYLKTLNKDTLNTNLIRKQVFNIENSMLMLIKRLLILKVIKEQLTDIFRI